VSTNNIFQRFAGKEYFTFKVKQLKNSVYSLQRLMTPEDLIIILHDSWN